MPVDRCADCGASLGTRTQETFPGMGVEKRCPDCETQYRAKWMVEALPDDDQADFERLSEWEQSFVTSVKAQVAAGRKLTEKQYQCVERIYERA